MVHHIHLMQQPDNALDVLFICFSYHLYFCFVKYDYTVSITTNYFRTAKITFFIYRAIFFLIFYSGQETISFLCTFSSYHLLHSTPKSTFSTYLIPNMPFLTEATHLLPIGLDILFKQYQKEVFSPSNLTFT